MTDATQTTESHPDILGMSDEDIMNANSPQDLVDIEAKRAEEKEAAEKAEAERIAAEEAAKAAETTDTETVETPEVKTETEVKTEVEEDPSKVETKDVKVPANKGSKVNEGTDANDASAKKNVEQKDDKSAVTTETPDFEKLYKQIVAPFKANGKTIEIRSPEEAIQLMQMGANYTRKMQEIQPHRKVLMMLQNNGLDEAKLSYLIDLDKKNPEAIKKLIKESGIDPLTIDTGTESTYQPGNHSVSNEAVSFQSALEDLSGSDEGKETVAHIHQHFDDASKNVLWEQPQLMQALHAQRQNGIFKIVDDEVARSRALGQIPAGVSYLHAYNVVLDALGKQGKFDHILKPATEVKTPVATEAKAVDPKVKNDPKAAAASTTRTSSKKAEKIVNPLNMSDDEFLKQMQNRV